MPMVWNGQVRTVTFDWRSIVLEAEPEFYANRRNELLYEFSNGREYRGDPNKVATAYPDGAFPDE